MKLWIFLCLGLVTSAGVTTIDTGTLLLIGVSRTSIILAADTETKNGQSAKGTAHKILRAGDFAACIFYGNTAIQTILTRGNEVKMGKKISFARIADDWIQQHPSETAKEAYSAIEPAIFNSMTEHQLHPEVGNPNDSFLGFGCIGYENSYAMVYFTDFYAPASLKENWRKERHDPVLLPPGFVAPLGRTKVSEEITKFNKSPYFSTFKNEVAVKKYRDAAPVTNRALLTEQDFLTIFRACLTATESKEGRQFDKDASDVGAPNDYAVISNKAGFRWIPDDSR